MNLKYYLRGLGIGILVTSLILGVALSHGKRELTDEEIKVRAADLGMIEEYETLKESVSKNEVNNEFEQASNFDAESVKDDSGFGTGIDEAKDKKADDIKSDDVSSDSEKSDSNAVDDKKTSDTESDKDALGDEKSNNDKTNSETGNDKKTSDTKSDETTEDKSGVNENQSVGASEDDKNITSVTISVKSGEGSFTVARRAEEAGLVSSASEFDEFLCQNGYDKRLRVGNFSIKSGSTMDQIAKILTGGQ